MRPDRVAQAQHVEAAHAVGLEHQARSDGPEDLDPVEHRHLPAGLSQPDGRAEATDPGTYHHCRARHGPPPLLQV
ncbi:hypothetical protein Acy02nite_01360 [Actinoplanes cyaneus]|uniref:Uncharacterized protein n=1 Tax=Actinoplanes cyaneus TaxID=52696 RepID=A0A919LXT8_9ACTN|nr:hypothetical protein Acy02nite_01360 [Actinoplanes cyaneus]